jgi:predicted TIM-barrel fold metal-dependent hydrolase
MPVLIHIADPPSYWRPVDENNPWRVALGEMPHWIYHGRDNFPSFDDLIRQRDSILRTHPDTTFIGAHLGSLAWDMEVADVAACLDEFPNLYVDASAVVDEIGRHPEKTRDLFLRYSDRILHGTDLIVMSVWETPREIARWVNEMARFHSTIFRFYETSETMPASQPHLRDWEIRGIDLPDDVLAKVYHENARRIIPRL